MLYLASSKRLERLILDPRVWGELDPDQMAYLQDVMSGCTFDAQLAPDDCKYINVLFAFKYFYIFAWLVYS